ncbi:hypothetical protein V4Y03_00860 [Streptomyces sp. P9-A4]
MIDNGVGVERFGESEPGLDVFLRDLTGRSPCTVGVRDDVLATGDVAALQKVNEVDAVLAAVLVQAVG